jgi:renalase
MKSDVDVLVIGAGVSGLAAAGELVRRGRRVLVLDRANGVGGRCASRTLHGQRVDYGAPFLHGSSPHFLGVVEACSTGVPAAHLLPGWPHRVLETRLACQPEAFGGAQRRLAVAEGVSTFPKRLAAGLDVRLGVTISLLHAIPGGIAAVAADGRRFEAAAVVLALAAPQSVRLLEPFAGRLAGGRERVRRLEAVDHVPCLTVVAGYRGDLPPLSFDAWYPAETTILSAVVHDSAKRPGGAWRVLVLQARRHYSLTLLEAPESEWSKDLVWEAGEILGGWAGRPEWQWTHRWRWARIPAGGGGVEVPEWLETDGGGRLGLCGDAFHEAGGVEGAFLSGIQLGRSLPEA